MLRTIWGDDDRYVDTYWSRFKKQGYFAGDGGPDNAALVKEVSDHVRKEIGPIAKPRQIMIVPELPKTRSGKIMRRLLRDVAEGRAVGDTQTLPTPRSWT